MTPTRASAEGGSKVGNSDSADDNLIAVRHTRSLTAARMGEIVAQVSISATKSGKKKKHTQSKLPALWKASGKKEDKAKGGKQKPLSPVEQAHLRRTLDVAERWRSRWREGAATGGVDDINNNDIDAGVAVGGDALRAKFASLMAASPVSTRGGGAGGAGSQPAFATTAHAATTSGHHLTGGNGESAVAAIVRAASGAAGAAMPPASAVEFSNISYIPHATITRYLGRVDVLLIKELKSTDKGLGAFAHQFLLEANAVARAQVMARGGNGLVDYTLTECKIYEEKKHQAYGVVTLSGDAVEYEKLTELM
jgi:hypothetical protein